MPIAEIAQLKSQRNEVANLEYLGEVTVPCGYLLLCGFFIFLNIRFDWFITQNLVLVLMFVPFIVCFVGLMFGLGIDEAESSKLDRRINELSRSVDLKDNVN